MILFENTDAMARKVQIPMDVVIAILGTVSVDNMDEGCEAVTPVFGSWLPVVCTRETNHEGAHVAQGTDGTIYAVWEDDE